MECRLVKFLFFHFPWKPDLSGCFTTPQRVLEHRACSHWVTIALLWTSREQNKCRSGFTWFHEFTLYKGFKKIAFMPQYNILFSITIITTCKITTIFAMSITLLCKTSRLPSHHIIWRKKCYKCLITYLVPLINVLYVHCIPSNDIHLMKKGNFTTAILLQPSSLLTCRGKSTWASI